MRCELWLLWRRVAPSSFKKVHFGLSQPVCSWIWTEKLHIFPASAHTSSWESENPFLQTRTNSHMISVFTFHSQHVDHGCLTLPRISYLLVLLTIGNCFLNMCCCNWLLTMTSLYSGFNGCAKCWSRQDWRLGQRIMCLFALFPLCSTIPLSIFIGVHENHAMSTSCWLLSQLCLVFLLLLLLPPSFQP